MSDQFGNVICLSEGLKDAVGLSSKFFLLENIKFKSRIHIESLFFRIHDTHGGMGLYNSNDSTLFV
jgi:hypothetical protein